MPKPPPRHESFATIDPTALAHVSGGARASSASRTAKSSSNSSSSSSSGSGASSEVLSALNGILDSLRDLSRGRTGGGFGAQEMMMVMMMMQQQRTVAVQPTSSLPIIYSNGTHRLL